MHPSSDLFLSSDPDTSVNNSKTIKHMWMNEIPYERALNSEQIDIQKNKLVTMWTCEKNSQMMMLLLPCFHMSGC